MEQHVSNRMDGGLNAQQETAVSIELLFAANDSAFFWSQGKLVAYIIKGGKSHD